METDSRGGTELESEEKDIPPQSVATAIEEHEIFIVKEEPLDLLSATHDERVEEIYISPRPIATAIDKDECFIAKEESLDPLAATDDESMAVEALRQLGGMYPEVGSVDKTSLLSCELCDLQFHTTLECQKHSALCHQPVNRLHMCNICGESFERKIDLGNHLVCHQVDRPYACKTCGNLFHRKADLQNHMVCHRIERPHQCPHCGVDFQRSSSLTNHMKIHSYTPGRALFLNNLSGASSDKNTRSQVPTYNNHIDETTQPVLPMKCLTRHRNSYSNSLSRNLTINNTSAKVSVFKQPVCDNWSVMYSQSGDSSVQVESSLMNRAAQNTNESAVLPVDGICEKFVGPAVSETDQSTKSCHNNNNESTINVKYINKNVVDNNETIESNSPEKQTESIVCNEDEMSNAVNECSTLTSNNNNDKKMCKHYTTGGVSVKVETMPYPPMGDTTPEIIPDQRESKKMLELSNTLRPHVCRHCGTAFARITALQSHARLHEDSWGSPLECDKCEEMFPETFSLRAHQAICRGKPQLQQLTTTQVINFSSQNISAAQSNMNEKKVTPKVGKHICSECDKKFTSKQKLFRHTWIHRKKPFVCDVCNISFKYQDRFDKHCRTVHSGQAPFVCKECGKSFESRPGIWAHSRVHGGGLTSPFCCQLCNKNFASRQGYLIHTRTHTGERPYACRYCWKAFRDSGTLRKHERIHTGERPHACPLCQRTFNQKVVLREHVRWIHAANKKGDSPGLVHLFTCQLCNEVLEDREALCAHIVKHSDKLAAIAKGKASKVKQDVEKNNSFPVNKTSKQKKVVHAKSKKIKPIKKKHSQTRKVNQVSTRLVSGSTYPPNTSNINECKHSCDMCGDVFLTRPELVNHVHIHI